MTDEERAFLQEVSAHAQERLAASACYLGLYSDDWKRDPVPLLQLAVALLLDKPIFFIVIRGATLPENMKRLALLVEEAGTKEEMEAAARRLMDRAVEAGYVPKRGEEERG